MERRSLQVTSRVTTEFSGVVKGSNIHGGSNNPHEKNNNLFQIFSEVAADVVVGTAACIVHVVVKSLITTVN